MKSPMMHLSISAELANDLAKIALKRGVSASEFVRAAVAEKLSNETGKDYAALKWGGHRAGGGRKPAQSAPPRRPVAADGEIKPRSRRAADAGTKKRRSSAA